MEPHDLSHILNDYREGKIDLRCALAAIHANVNRTVEATTIDFDRQRRTGEAEVIYGEHKTPEQICAALKSIIQNHNNALVTRVSNDAAEYIQSKFPKLTYVPAGKIAYQIVSPPSPSKTTVGVVCAGTSDLKVAEEAICTLEFFGSRVQRFYDIGVAGIHRLFHCLEALRTCRVVVVIAGMEGALPSVVAGLLDCPVIAVPTSIGYGASFNGVTALLGMLNSCSTGISVVNIDNGFGAGYFANKINRL